MRCNGNRRNFLYAYVTGRMLARNSLWLCFHQQNANILCSTTSSIFISRFPPLCLFFDAREASCFRKVSVENTYKAGAFFVRHFIFSLMLSLLCLVVILQLNKNWYSLKTNYIKSHCKIKSLFFFLDFSGDVLRGRDTKQYSVVRIYGHKTLLRCNMRRYKSPKRIYD